MNKCIKCDSTSTILDGLSWVCFQHINPCKCSRDHDLGLEWDFRKREGGISYTLEAMEREMPDKYDTENQSGGGRS